jgi:hypothetical protein
MVILFLDLGFLGILGSTILIPPRGGAAGTVFFHRRNPYQNMYIFLLLDLEIGMVILFLDVGSHSKLTGQVVCYLGGAIRTEVGTCSNYEAFE